VQTISDVTSDKGNNYSKELDSLYKRLGVIEEVLADKDSEILQLKTSANNNCTVNSGVKLNKSELVEMSVQAEIPADDSIQISEFTKDEVDEILHKLKSAHDKISLKDELIQQYEFNLSQIQREMNELQISVEDQKDSYNEQKAIDDQKLQLQKEQQIIIEELNDKLIQSEEYNQNIMQEYDQLQHEFDSYKEVKEHEMAELKIDYDNIHTEYEEYKDHYNDYNLSTNNLKQWLERLKSDYKLLSLENTTLQELLQKEKTINKNSQSQSYDKRQGSNRKDNSVDMFSKSQVTPYVPLKPEERHFTIEQETEDPRRHYSVTRALRSSKFSPKRHETLEQEDDCYQLNFKRDQENDERQYFTSQSPVLQHGVPRSVGSNRGSKFSLNSNSPWLKTPF